MNSAPFSFVRTASGALALRDEAGGEVMHPGLGPRAEAEQIYVAPARLAERLAERAGEPLVLLDVGLGAGSNAVRALELAEQLAPGTRKLELLSFDRSCAALSYVLASEQREAFGLTPRIAAACEQLLARGQYESASVRWRLSLGDALEGLAREPARSADVVFWDPFSPRADAGLWSERAFRLLRRVCRDGATVHTYSAATATRSALLLSGFFVGHGPACGEKQKSTTMAATRRADLAQPLARDWLRGLPRVDTSAREPALAPEARVRLAQHPQFTRW